MVHLNSEKRAILASMGGVLANRRASHSQAICFILESEETDEKFESFPKIRTTRQRYEVGFESIFGTQKPPFSSAKK